MRLGWGAREEYETEAAGAAVRGSTFPEYPLLRTMTPGCEGLRALGTIPYPYSHPSGVCMCTTSPHITPTTMPCTSVTPRVPHIT